MLFSWAAPISDIFTSIVLQPKDGNVLSVQVEPIKRAYSPQLDAGSFNDPYSTIPLLSLSIIIN
jgi:hypothetical protein